MQALIYTHAGSNTTNSTVPNTIIVTLKTISFQLNIYFGLFIFITGNISASGNFVVFSSRTFRTRACSIYLVAESVFTSAYFNTVLSTRIIQKGFDFPILDRYDVICRIRQFLAEYTRQMAFNLFTLATVDRLLLTHRSAACRRWSNRVCLAYKIIPVLAVLWFPFLAHRLFLYTTSTGKCSAQSGTYETYDKLSEVAMSAIIPPIILVTLNCFLLRNFRTVSRKRIAPATPSQITHTSPAYIQQMENQLTRMILLQSSVAIFSFSLFGVQNLYSSITKNRLKSSLQHAWENAITEIIRLSAYLFYSTSFYISLLSNRGFRKQALHSFGMQRSTKTSTLVHTNAQTVPTNTIQKKQP